MINDLFFKEFPVIESNRLILRKITIDDAPFIYEIRSNDEVMKFMDSNPHLSIQDSKKFIEKGLQTYSKKEGIFWSIINKDSKVHMGDIAIWKIIRDDHRGEIGYTLLPQFWGHGYMSEALSSIIKFGFQELKLHSFQAEINPENENSKNLLRKIGFKKEAYFVENRFFNDRYYDSEIYSLLEKYYTPK